MCKFTVDSMAATPAKAPIPADSGLPRSTDGLPSCDVIFGQTAIMAMVRRKVEKSAATGVPILIEGPNGCGKEMIARYAHAISPRREGSFAKVNCAALPGPLMESELFGYERGAFTGAVNAKPGRLEAETPGTLLLDEVSELNGDLQSKLLQVLQDGKFYRIGGLDEKSLISSVISTSCRPLTDEIDRGRFRADLYYRINVIKVELVPLRERREDILALANYFREEMLKVHQCEAPPLTSTFCEWLKEYDWPGNIRELQNTISRYVLLGLEAAIQSLGTVGGSENLAVQVPSNGSKRLFAATSTAVRDVERKIILQALAENRWNRRKAAAALKISYRTLLSKIKQAGLPRRRDIAQNILNGPNNFPPQTIN
ncbi:MAG TPA: sigma-54 dependent transcriptional regulator [Candidatus Acidoferrum sp.]|nr:sigma-54 dependent transcriptional regulator [Candidatus Acidoferrum sp.]